MNNYADSSFLASLYLVDGNSEAARRYAGTDITKLPLTSFGVFELRNAIRGSVIRGTSNAVEARRVLARVEQELVNGRLVRTSCNWDEVYREAENLSNLHTMTGGHRALDVLHVAVALVLGCSVFLTFDRRQAELARLAGLTVHP